MSKITIIEPNSKNKDNLKAFFLKGEKGDTGNTGNGIQSIEKTSTSGNIDTYTITFTNGTTTTFQVANGDGATVIIDNLTDTSIDKALSANQGKVLKEFIDDLTSSMQDIDDEKVNITDIVDNLTDTSTNKPLSANQGKELKSLIDNKVYSCITAKLTADTVVSSSSFDIPLDSSVSSGTGLTLNNRGKIVIGAGITKVKVSAHIDSQKTSSSSGNFRYIYIYHYSSTLESDYVVKEYIFNVPDYMKTNFTPVLIDVAEGDTIYIDYSSGENDKILGGAQGDTYITVEEVE